MEKPEFRVSNLVLLENCGEAFRRRVIEKEPFVSNYRITIGKSCHKARELNLKFKMEHQENISIDATKDIARDEIVNSFENEDIRLEPELENLPIKYIRDNAIDEAVLMAKEDYYTYLINSNPVAVEEKIFVELKNFPFDFHGTLDTVEKERKYLFYRDLKTSGRKPPETIADSSEQLTLYSILFAAKYQTYFNELSLDFIIYHKKNILARRFRTIRTDEDHKAILERLSVMYDSVTKGVFMPCSSSYWMCNANYCQFYNTCKYVIKGKKRHEKY